MLVDAGARALYLGPAFTLGAHRNAVAVLAIGLDRPFELADGHALDDPLPRRCALIPPGQWHRLDAQGGPMAFLYLDASDRGTRAVAGRMARPGAAALATGIAALQALWRQDAPDAAAWAAVATAIGLPEAIAPDPGIAAAMAAVQQAPADPHPVASHAALAGCAASTFQRRFTAQTGLPWRRWRLWQRIRHATQAVCTGQDLTRAALEAGFASGAHFSDTFRAMFGLPPRRLVDWGVRWRPAGEPGSR